MLLPLKWIYANNRAIIAKKNFSKKISKNRVGVGESYIYSKTIIMGRISKLKKTLINEANRQLLKESCTCYTANPVGGGAMLVYDLCQQGTQAASCSCCCSAWLHPHYVEDQECLTTSVAPPSSGGGNDDGLGLYANDFLTVDDLDTGDLGGITTNQYDKPSKASGFIERDSREIDILIPKDREGSGDYRY